MLAGYDSTMIPPSNDVEIPEPDDFTLCHHCNEPLLDEQSKWSALADFDEDGNNYYYWHVGCDGGRR